VGGGATAVHGELLRLGIPGSRPNQTTGAGYPDPKAAQGPPSQGLGDFSLRDFPRAAIVPLDLSVVRTIFFLVQKLSTAWVILRHSEDDWLDKGVKRGQFRQPRLGLQRSCDPSFFPGDEGRVAPRPNLSPAEPRRRKHSVSRVQPAGRSRCNADPAAQTLPHRNRRWAGKRATLGGG